MTDWFLFKVLQEDCVSEVLLTSENSFGQSFVMTVCLSITLSPLGISKRCLDYLLLHVCRHETEIEEAASNNGASVNGILVSLAGLLTTKWMNGVLFYSWLDASIGELVDGRFLEHTALRSRVSAAILEFLVNDPNKYDVALLPTSSVHNGFSQQQQEQICKGVCYNYEKIQLLPLYLMKAGNVGELKSRALCNFSFLLDKLRACTLAHLFDDFHQASAVFSLDIDLKVLLEVFALANEALLFDVEQFPAQIIARLYPLMPAEHVERVHRRERSFSLEQQTLPVLDGTESSEKETWGKHEDGSTEGGQNQNKLDIAADTKCITQSAILAQLINDALSKGHCLMPSVRCLLRPPTECGSFPENQISSFWLSNDTRILFLKNHPDEFVSWSAIKQTVAVHNSKTGSIQTHQGLKFKRILLATNFDVVMEMQDKSVCMYSLEAGQITSTLERGLSYFAVCNELHLAALSADWSCLSIYNTESREVVWRLPAPDQRSFHNVLISKNGSIGACILEAVSPHGGINVPPGIDMDDGTPVGCHDEIIVVDLRSWQQLHRITLRHDQSVNKQCAISEDGHYLIHLTEPSYQILVWNLIKGTLIREIETRLYRILKILVSTQGNCIMSISADSVLRVWNLREGDLRFSLCEQIRSIRGGYMDDSHCMSMSEDGRRAVHSAKSRFHHSYVVLWDLVLGRQLGSFTTDYYGLPYEMNPGGDFVTSCMPTGVVILGSKGLKALSN